MPIKMLAPFKQFKKDQIVNPEADLTAWLITRQYATPMSDETAPPVAVATELPQIKKGKK